MAVKRTKTKTPSRSDIRAQQTNPSVKHSVLVVDDDCTASRSLIKALQRRGATEEFVHADSSTKALVLAKKHSPGACLVDLCLNPQQGPQSGLDLLIELQKLDTTSRLLVLTGHGSTEFGVRALRNGAASFLEKPVDVDHLHALLKDALAYSSLKRQYLKLSTKTRNLPFICGLNSQNPAMIAVLQGVAYAASNAQSVLITGETGTGKGVLAQAIHQASSRNKASFIRFLPSYISHDLVASELFGHRKGAFTGATEARSGLVEAADQGTLFIDEVAELPHDTQVLLLNTLQEKIFRRLGSPLELRSDFRLISATNRSNKEIAEKRLLRSDFFHRIAHFQLHIPPLRERTEDIPTLAESFINSLNTREKLQVQGLSTSALDKLLSHHWPGNVRELQAVVEGAVFRTQFQQKPFIEPEDIELLATEGQFFSPFAFREKVAAYEKSLVMEALQKTEGNQSEAAKLLKMDRSYLRRILER